MSNVLMFLSLGAAARNRLRTGLVWQRVRRLPDSVRGDEEPERRQLGPDSLLAEVRHQVPQGPQDRRGWSRDWDRHGPARRNERIERFERCVSDVMILR